MQELDAVSASNHGSKLTTIKDLVDRVIQRAFQFVSVFSNLNILGGPSYSLLNMKTINNVANNGCLKLNEFQCTEILPLVSFKFVY